MALYKIYHFLVTGKTRSGLAKPCGSQSPHWLRATSLLTSIATSGVALLQRIGLDERANAVPSLGGAKYVQPERARAEGANVHCHCDPELELERRLFGLVPQ